MIAVFGRLGVVGFGGPAAHIALMRDEVVRRRRWVDDRGFLDLLGATNLIPGPNSTEMAIHLGFVRAGRPGLVAGGLAFILPAVGMVLALAWAYERYGTTAEAGWLLYGVKPVVIAVVLDALATLAPVIARRRVGAALAVAAFALYLAGVNELLLLLLAAGVMAALWASAPRPAGRAAGLLGALPGWALLPPLAGAGFSLAGLFLFFLKVGAVLYGSGYVLLAFLRGDLVVRLGWLTDRQLLDAVAVGQLTPGPLLATATFIGYVLGSWPGAALATLGIFLPSFCYVAATGPLLPRLRRRQWTSGLLDGVSAAALGLMAAVSLQLGRTAIVDVYTGLAAGLALVLLLVLRVNSAVLIALGGLGGLVRYLLV